MKKQKLRRERSERYINGISWKRERIADLRKDSSEANASPVTCAKRTLEAQLLVVKKISGFSLAECKIYLRLVFFYLRSFLALTPASFPFFSLMQ